MKVTQIEVAVNSREPNPDPIRDALQSLPGSGSVQVIVRTDEGVSGTGDVSFGRVAGAPDALAGIIQHELKPLVIGTDPAMVRGTHEAMLRETEYHGSFGLTMFGIAAIDTALWDCLGRARGVPCWQLWGGIHTLIPAYAMVGWLNYSDEKVQQICAKAVEQGFRGVKIKVGYPTLAEDIKRVKIVRKAIGDDVVDILLNSENYDNPKALAWRKITAVQTAIERVLGATPGSLPLTDEQTLAAWFED